MAMNKNRFGYTMIEFLTVVAITSILRVAAVRILYQGQLRSAQSEGLNKMRQEGNLVLDVLTYQLRNALEAQCTGVNELVVTSPNGQNITYGLTDLSPSGTAVASDGAALPTADVDVQNLSFSCTSSGQNSGTLVNVDLTLTVPELTSSIADFNQVFSTSVYVRDFN